MHPVAEGLLRDLQHAVRSLSRARGFTSIVIASLTLGLTLTGATLGVLNAYLIRPLPYADPEQLFHLRYAPPGPWEPRGMSSLDWRSLADIVAHPITSTAETFHLADSGYAQSVRGLRVNRGYIEGLGVRAILGRTLGTDDFVIAPERPALMGYALWRERYGSDPAVIGRVLAVEADAPRAAPERVRIVGVLPESFYFGRDGQDRADLIVPSVAAARTYLVKLREGVTPATAEARITSAARSVARDLPPDWAGVHLESMTERYAGPVRRVLVGSTAAALLVLVIVCANVAVLMLLRGMRRQKELAIRLSLGCDRVQLVRMLAVESAVLCGAALMAALALSRLLLSVLAPTIQMQLGRTVPGEAAAITVDRTVVLLVAAAAAVVSVALAFVPLAGGSRNLASRMSGEAGAAWGRHPARHLRSGLIAFQIAGTLVLLVACGLFVRSALTMLRSDLGFDASALVRSRVVLRSADYADGAAFAAFYARFAERVATTAQAPVVFTNWPPFAEFPKRTVEAADETAAATAAGGISVGAGYFSTFGVPLRSGRDFVEEDAHASESVAVVSETLARALWPRTDAVGRQVRIVEQTPAGPRRGAPRVVIGVAADVRQAYADSETSDLYVPLSASERGRFGSFYVRTEQPPSVLYDKLQQAAAELDPRAVVGTPRVVEADNRELASARFLSWILTGVTAAAALLAVVGIYGITAYAVQQREREIAIRIALGAAGRVVVRTIVGETARVLVVGLALGAAGGVAVTRLVAQQLHGVRAFDPLTIGGAGLLLACATVAASWWPARRAARCNPIVLLKAVR